MGKISECIENLVNLYGTNSPFELCKKLNINIIFIDLPENTNGLFVKTKENMKLILIKNTLKIKEIRKVCAHELAHATLHRNSKNWIKKPITLLNIFFRTKKRHLNKLLSLKISNFEIL